MPSRLPQKRASINSMQRRLGGQIANVLVEFHVALFCCWLIVAIDSVITIHRHIRPMVWRIGPIAADAATHGPKTAVEIAPFPDAP